MSRRGSPSNRHPSNNVQGQRSSPQGQETNLDAQRDLQEVSAALETAFDRIRQVRRNLLRFSETLPANGATPSTMGRNEIRPGHEALLLSGGPMQADRREPFSISSISTSQQGPFIDILETSPSIQPIPPPSPRYPYTTEPPTFLHVPPVPSVLPPRFSRQTSFNTLPGSSAETAATTHGLRVAAREANSTAHDMYRDRPDLVSLAADYDRRYAQFRATAHASTAAAAVHPPLPSPPGFPLLDDLGSVNIRRDGRRYRSTLPSPITFSTSAVPPRPGEVYRSHWQWDRYPAMSDPLLSNPPVFDRSTRLNYLPRPPMQPSGTRSMAMPLSSNSAPAIPMIPAPFAPSPNVRSGALAPENSYGAMPRMEAAISGSNSPFDSPDWTNDQFISWLLPQEHPPSLVPRRDPQNPETIRITRTTEGSSPPMPAGPRRRGWARLDPDGNEIPWDEEEALERSRTEYRLRALHQSQDGMDPSEMHRGVYDGQVFHGSVLDSMLSIPSVMTTSSQRTEELRQPQQRRRRGGGEGGSRVPSPPSADVCPFYVDPLPMPLSITRGKVERVNNNMEECYPDVIVPKYAFLAGR